MKRLSSTPDHASAWCPAQAGLVAFVARPVWAARVRLKGLKGGRILSTIRILRTIRLFPTILCLLSGCSSLSLRPVNPDHVARKAEVTRRLGIDETNLNQVLKDDQQACDKLDRTVMGWTGTSVAMGSLAGGSGVTSLFTESTSRYVVGGLGIGLAAFAAVSAYLSTAYASKYSRQCTVNTGGR